MHSSLFAVLAWAEKSRSGGSNQERTVGDGPLLAAHQAMVRELDLETVFVFHGPQRHKVVLSMMQQADVFVALSVTGSDGDQKGISVPDVFQIVSHKERTV
jgi:colanic acid/amylovoran biosynthesis glycosyltransferase